MIILKAVLLTAAVAGTYYACSYAYERLLTGEYVRRVKELAWANTPPVVVDARFQ